MKYNMIKIVEIMAIIFMIIMLFASFTVAFLINDFGKELEKEYSNRLMSRHIETNEKYELVDMIISKSNPNKAYIYKSKFESIDATVRDLIESVPMKVEKIVEDGNEETNCIGIITQIEYAYIYEKDGEIYVQNANSLFLDNDGGYAYDEDQNESYLKAYNQEFFNSDYNFFIQDVRNKFEQAFE